MVLLKLNVCASELFNEKIYIPIWCYLNFVDLQLFDQKLYNLHSNMVLLKLNMFTWENLPETNLHSNMVLLKP